MSFHASCEAFQLVDGHILKARCKNTRGEWKNSEIDLAHFVGNSDGWFIWDGKDFHKSARALNLEGGHYLTADLPKRDGGYRERQGIELNDRISNQDGRLVYIGGK
ncbi:Cyanovirin-N [Ascobolus immersus RN42]|uniref:Cyanovirin-N n=1 Tax=Ascobolus immersus RN42 TaxID=1160509 RepID=A0A3N4I2U9_ASCIM|nr:Cyanovirin-N [Ascobolus immersus RN42]